MGISKRNPRGNFNWQYRYLKRNPKGECCGVPEPDCGQFKPSLAKVYQTDPCLVNGVGALLSVQILNTQDPLIAATTTWEWYFNGSLVYASGPGSSSTYTKFGVTKADSGVYTIIAVNEFGCKTEQDFKVYLFETPTFAVNLTDSDYLGGDDWLCNPDPLSPSGYSGTGAIDITISFPDPDVVYYRYKILHGPSTSSNGYQYVLDTDSATLNYSDICNGEYTVTIELWAERDGVVQKVCFYSYMVHVGPFILGWDSITNVPVANPTNPADWQPLFAVFGTNLRVSNAVVNGDQVWLRFASLTMPPSNYTLTASGALTANVNLVSLNDQGGYVNYVNTYTFDSCSALSFVKMHSVSNISAFGFSNTGPFEAYFPVCVSLGNQAFFNSQIPKANFPILGKLLQSNEFFGTAFLTAIALPEVNVIGSGSAFQGSGITSIYLPSLIQMDGATHFYNCANLQTIDFPICQTISGTQHFAFCNALTDINLPLVQPYLGNTAGDDVIFQGTTGNTINATFPSSFQTVNAGSTEGDVRYLQLNNTVTVTWV